MTDNEMTRARLSIVGAWSLEDKMVQAGVNRGFSPEESRKMFNSWVRGNSNTYTSAWRAAIVAEFPGID